MRSIASRCGRTVAGSRSGASAASAALVEVRARGEVVERPAEDDHADVDPLAALDARHDADDRVGEGVTALTGTLGLHDEGARRLEPRREIVDVDPAVGAVEPRGRNRRGDLLEQLARHDRARAARRPRRSSRRTAAARARRSPRTAAARARRGRRRRGGSRARRRGRSATAGRASEQVRVLRRAVDVRHERVEPDDVGRELRRRVGPGRRAERQRARAGSRRRGSGPRSRAADPGSRRPARRGRSRGRARRRASSGTAKPSARASSPATTSATSALRPWPAPRNLST